MNRSVPLLAVVAILLMAGPVVAQQETELCIRVEAPADVDLTNALAVQEGIRTGEIFVTDVVACDGASAPPASLAPVSDVGTGAWIVGPIEDDPVTGDRRASASLLAEEEAYWTGEPYTLTITCSRGFTDVIVTWRWDFGPERLVDVDTRIGDGEFTTEAWFNDGPTTSYGHDDVAFIESLFGETRLAQQAVVPDTGLAVAVFDISGIENAVTNVREACGW